VKTRCIQIWLVAALILTGCATTATTPKGEVRRLMNFPGFQDAGRVAPGWTVEALDTVAGLEHELSKYR